MFCTKAGLRHLKKKKSSEAKAHGNLSEFKCLSEGYTLMICACERW